MGGVVPLLTLLACGETTYRPVDRQLDLDARVPDQAEQLRICVQGAGAMSFGARYDGHFAMTGLPAGLPEPILVTVDAMADEQLVGQWEGELTGAYNSGSAALCTLESAQETGALACEPCRADGQMATEEEASWVLGLRFSG